MRLRYAALYLTIAVLVAAICFTFALQFQNDGRPFSWNRTESVNV